MEQRITILVATMTGTAELVAEDVAAVLGEAGFEAQVLAMDGRDAAVFERPGRFIICSSTYGQGDVPDNGRLLYDDLKERRPDLSSVQYGVIGLGDSTYVDTYCNGGRRFDEALAALGARRIGERLEHNANGDSLPEEAGVEWARGWLRQLGPLAEAAE